VRHSFHAKGTSRVGGGILHEETFSFSTFEIQIFNIEFAQAACYKATRS
jgi:hypothetical protein